MNKSYNNYSKSGRPVSVNEDNYAFANDRMNDRIRQAEFARKLKSATEKTAFSKSKVILHWVTALLSWIHIG